MHRLVTRLPLRTALQRRPLTQPLRFPVVAIPSVTPRQNRHFTSSPALNKKKDKGAKKGANSDVEASSAAATTTEDPFDLSTLHSGISTAISKLKDDLSKLRAGGRFNTATLEGLKVQLSKDSQNVVRLGDLAQVVPKGGRMITILAAEEQHIKPVTSAIVASNLSLTPQPDAHNALQLNIPIPPPTKESRDKNVQAAKQAFEKAANAVRDSRGAMHKRLQTMEKKKLARPDDVRKAHDHMEKATEKGQKDAKELFDAAKKSLEQA